MRCFKIGEPKINIFLFIGTKNMLFNNYVLAIELLNKDCSQRHPSYALVHQIKSYWSSNPNIQCMHTLREANQVADRLAKFGLSLDERCHIFETIPAFLDLAVSADRASVSFPHGF